MNPKWTMAALLLLAGCAHFQPQPITPAETAAGLESRTLDALEFKAFLETNLSRHFESWPLKSWDFETLTLAALYYHPSLDVARAQWAVAIGGDKTAAGRPNPTVSAIPGYNFSATGGVNPWIPAVSFDVPIETAGKRTYRKAQAAHLTEAARLNIAVAAWQVRANLRAALLDLAAAGQREQLLQKQTSLQQRITRSLDQQFEAGAVSSFETSQAQTAFAKNRLDLADARRQQADARVRVAEAIGVPVKALDGLVLEYDLAAIPAAAAEMTSAEARSRALQNRADILGALAEYAASQSALQLEIARQYPDLHLGPGYQYDQGDHKFTFALTLDLPVLNQNQGPIAEAAARRTAAAARFLELQAKVIAEIDRAVADCQVMRENLPALEALAAAREKQTRTTEAMQAAGAAAQFDTLNAQIELGASELVQLEGRIRLQQSYAALEDALQRPVDSLSPPVIEQPARQTATERKP